MKQLYLRIYLTVLAALALFALASGWLVQRHLDETRERAEGVLRERSAAWGELLQRSLPDAAAAPAEQVAALREWSQRLRLPMALDDAHGHRLGASDSFVRRGYDGPELGVRAQAIAFDDGRTLWVPRPGSARAGAAAAAAAGGLTEPHLAVRGVPALQPWWALWPSQGRGRAPDGLGLLALLVVLFLAVAAGAWPVVRRLTRRLEVLKQGVEAFGAGDLQRRVPEEGGDEVGALAASFNRTASRIQTLVQSHQSLLANASHELRSPLARLKMAVAILEESPTAEPEQRGSGRQALRREIDTNIAELDALVDEVLLASRLEGAEDLGQFEAVDLAALAAEEGARVGAVLEGAASRPVQGTERLLRRAVRNLLDNARRYGSASIEVSVCQRPGQTELRVCDRGPGVQEIYRERIFEPFFRLPGHAEREGGVGLGLALVRQIAARHGGAVRCEPREGGGSCFVLTLPGG
jgi:signal transduction histidine kinase